MVKDSDFLPNPTAYSEVLQGNHPLIKTPLHKLDGPKRQALALHYLQREAFTPLCINLADQILGLGPDDIQHTAMNFKTQPHVQKFLNEKEDYFAATYELIRFKNRKNGPRAMLSRYLELKSLYDNMSMSEIQLREFYQLVVFFSTKDENTLSRYEKLAETSRKRPLKSSEQKRLSAYIDELITWEDPDRIERFAHAFNAPTSEQELDGLIELMSGIENNAHYNKFHGLQYSSYKYFLWALTESQNNHFADNLIFAPIGQYGPELTIRLLQTGRSLVKLADMFSSEEAKAMQQTYPELVRFKTTRGKDKDPEEISPNPPLTTLQEGIVAITNALSLLSAVRVGNYSGQALVEYLLHKGFVNRLAHMLTSGFLQPTLFAGKYIKDLLIIDSNQQISFSQIFLVYMAGVRRLGQESLEQGDIKNDQFTFYGCPVASREPGRKRSGIDALSEAFLYVFNTYNFTQST